MTTRARSRALLLLIVWGACWAACDYWEDKGVDPEPEPELVVAPTMLEFDPSVAVRTFEVVNDGGGQLVWEVTVAAEAPWCTVTPTAGSASATIRVDVDRRALAAGEHTVPITIASNGGSAVLTVRVQVAPATGEIGIDAPVPPREPPDAAGPDE